LWVRLILILQSKHNFLSAIIEDKWLICLSNHNVASILKEDVRNYLDPQDIIFTPDFLFRRFSWVGI
jgi:hypothetical protein